MNGLKTDTIINRDALYALRELPEESVHCCVTSPPYYALRDYGLDMQIGREDTPEQYIDRLTEVFRELRRVLRSDGTLWLNIADTYCGTGNKGYLLRFHVLRLDERHTWDFLHVGGQRPCGDGEQLRRKGKRASAAD